MIWYICAIAAVMLFVVTAMVSVDTKHGSKKVFYIFVLFTVSTYILYIPPFFIGYEPIAAVWGSLYNILQVISLESGCLDWYDFITASIGFGLFEKIYIALLGFVHIALPAVSAVSAITLVLHFLATVRLSVVNHRRRPIFVFSEINNKSEALARNIRETIGKCDIVFSDISGVAEKNVLQQELNCIVYEKSIESIQIKHVADKEIYYFCITGDSDINLNHTLDLINDSRDLPTEVQQKIHVFLFADGDNVDIMIDSSDKGNIDIHVVNEIETIAYDLLNEYPLCKHATNSEISILLCGLDKLDKAFLRAALWCGQLAGYKLKVRVVGIDIEKEIENMKLWFPGLFTDRYDVEFYSCIGDKDFADTVDKHCRDANYIVVNRENDEETVNIAILLRRMFYKFDSEYKNAPPIYAYIRYSDKAKMVRNLQTSEANPERRTSYDITPFGYYGDIYTYNNLVDSDIEKLSKNVHLVYEDIFSEADIDVQAALGRYKIFEVNKRSNRANAMHIRYKLALLGLDYTDADADGEEVELKDYLEKEKLDMLSYSEHNRWMAFLESEGWETATIDQVNAYKASDISKGRHNCPVLQLHPYICAYEELPERSEKLGLPDSTVYDRELIARIPDILGDKWNAVGKRFKIVKR